VKIQSAARRHNGQRAYKRAVTIYHGFCVFRAIYGGVAFSRKTTAAKIIQSAWKCHRTRKAVALLLFIRKVQCASRAYNARFKVLAMRDDAYLFQSINLRKFQAGTRAYLARMKISKLLHAKRAFPPANTTAFPSLNTTDTCSCIHQQSAQPIKGVMNKGVKAIFRDKHLVGFYMPLITESSVEYVVTKTFKKKPSGSEVFLSIRQKPRSWHSRVCNAESYEIVERLACHLASGHGLDDGHAANVIYTFSCDDTGINSLVPKFAENDNHYDLSYDEASLNYPACPCQAGLALEAKYSVRRSHFTSPLVAGRVLTSAEASLARSLLAISTAEYWKQLNGRPMPIKLADVIDEADKEIYALVPPTAKEEEVKIRHHVMPHFLKRRIKRWESLVAREARLHGLIILKDHSFDAKSYQEWCEMECRRYEDAETMSYSERVCSSNQGAQLYLRGSYARHEMARIVRTWVRDESRGQAMFAKFNEDFVKYHHGNHLIMPAPLIAKIARERAQLVIREQDMSEQLRERDAREARNLMTLAEKAQAKAREKAFNRRELA
jgi:hypothetical protein